MIQPNKKVEKIRKFKLPASLLVLDIIGALLVAQGIYLMVSESRGVFYIAAGALLMVPLIRHILKNSGNHSEKNGGGKDNG